ncbi:MAG: gliding motility-associated C-terminal domain-containing protein [Saprospiraceae bacterium]
MININSVIQAPPIPVIPVSENCSAVVETFVETPRPDTCKSGTFTRTWRATDAAGNTGVFTQTINVFADTLPPQVNGNPQNGSAPCAQLATAYPAWLAAQMVNFTAVDPSSPIVFSNSGPAVFPPGCAGPLTVIFRATDQCGLRATRTATFTTSDTQPPFIVQAPKDSLSACAPDSNHVKALSDWIQRRARLIARDSCSAESEQRVDFFINGVQRDSAQIIAAFLASFADGCGPQTINGVTVQKVRAKVTVDFFAKDPCNNQTYAGKALFAAVDTLPPIITGASPVFEECGGGNDQQALQNWIDNHGNASWQDDCSSASWTNFSWSSSNGQSGNGVFGAGPYPQVLADSCNWFVDVTFRATDDCGNVGSRTLRWRIRDTQPPTLSVGASGGAIFCPQPFPTTFTGTVSDNCDAAPTLTYSYAFADTVCVGNYTLRVTWTATDDCGNAASATQSFLIRDIQPPVFTQTPPGITVGCENFTALPLPIPGVDVLATDVCGALDTIIVTQVSNQNPDPGVCGHYQFSIIRIFTARDECGNTAFATQIVQVTDNTPPVFSGFLDTTAVCDVPPMMPPPILSDNCGGPVAAPTLLSEVITAGPCAEAYTITLQWRAADVCGNTSQFSQQIKVQDTVKPTLSGVPAHITVDCDGVPPIPALQTIIGSDNCDESVGISFNEIVVRDPNPASCAYYTNYLVRREWTAADNCGNTAVYTQNIQVLDMTGPELTLPATVALPADPGFCGAEILPPVPLAIYDRCTAIPGNVILRDTALLKTSSGQIPSSAPVDTIVFSWLAPNAPPFAPATGSGQLRIALDNADAESPEEYLLVYGENGMLLGRTANSANSCGASDTLFQIAPNLLNAWLSDGVLEITLAPFGSGPNALNPFCQGGGKARAELSFPVAAQQVPITVQFSIDGGPVQPFPATATSFLSVGNHVLTYIATDCAGNSASATLPLQVKDVEAPTLVTTPPPPFYVGAGGCLADVLLPFPGITENCGLSGIYRDTTDLISVQFENDPNAGIVPKNIQFVFTGVVPNAVTGGLLRILHRGQNALPGEFFNVFGEGGVFLDETTYGPPGDQCLKFHETTIPITATQINNWASDGQISIRLEANRDVLNFIHFINPCGSLQPNGTDPFSAVQAALEYDYGAVQYEIFKNNVNGALEGSGTLFGNQTTQSLSPGNFVVRYSTTDAAGAAGISTFPLLVRDTIKPKALCINKTILVNASGEVPYNLSPAEINNGSSDNCSAVSLQASPTTFTCNQVGGPYPVTLTVTDTSGNSSTCQALIRVETAPFSPAYTPVCVGEPLELMANPPSTPGGNSVYTFAWSGPNGYASNQQNPVIANTFLFGSGTYTVTVTGLTGCMATGVVSVDLIKLPDTPTILVNDDSLCLGQNLTLSTGAVLGSGVQYRWFAGSPPGGALIATTTQPTLTVTSPPANTYQYYVQVRANGCASQPSQPVTLQVFSIPVATVAQPLINLCECQPLALNATVQGQGILYSWSGPNGFQSPLQNPPVKPCAALSDSGIYTLTVFRNGCASAPATVIVSVTPKPPMPQISGAGAFCAGATVQLTASVPTAAQYLWTGPDFQTDTTTLNSLSINNITQADSGQWRVTVIQLGCASDPSPEVTIRVEAYPQVSAGANTPLCQGFPLQLTASSNQNPLNYSWKGPNGFQSFEQNPAPPPVPGDYIVTASTLLANCASSDTVTVVVATPPIIAAVTSDAPLCSDGSQTVTLSATIVTNYPPLKYQWFGPNMFQSTSSNPTIAAATSANNGNYVLTVRDNLGCQSAAATVTLAISDVPPRPTIVPPTAICAGANVTLTISNDAQYSAGNFTFIWRLPDNTTQTTTAPSLDIPAAGLQAAGTYSVEVASANCTSQPSAPVQLTVYPIPPPPSITATPNPVCAGATLQLSVPSTPNTFFAWTGPMGFSATVFNPAIVQIDTAQTGNYNCQITQNGCTSPLGEGIFVLVKPRPAIPVLVPPAAFCLDQPDSLHRQITQNSTTPQAQYVWINSLNDTIAGPQSSSQTAVINFSDFPPGLNTIRAIAHLNGCNSALSAPVTVQADTIPDDIASAGSDRAACEGALQLDATPALSGASGRWTQVGGPPATINTPSQPKTIVNGLLAGNQYRYAWTLSNGACENYSADTVAIQVAAFEQAVAVDQIDTCFVTSIQLSAVQGAAAPGVWSQPPGQQLLGIQIPNPQQPNAVVDSLQPGNTYYFIWTLPDIGCGASTDTTTVRIIGSVAFAGSDRTICNADSCALAEAAPLPAGEFGAWSSDNPVLIFASPTNPTTTVCGLQPGLNRVFWTTNGGKCGNLSRDTLLLTYEPVPLVRSDTVFVPFGFKKNFSVVLNDILPPRFSLEIVDTPAQGRLERTQETGNFNYQPNIGFTGTDDMLYQVCNLNCTGACSTGQVVFIVEEALDCEIPTVITPNGDGVNDLFFVPCLNVDSVLDNEVTIFNQWGDEVFHAQPYDNNWEGTFNGEPLPTGTYFFVVKFNGNAGVKTGFLIIQR